MTTASLAMVAAAVLLAAAGSVGLHLVSARNAADGRLETLSVTILSIIAAAGAGLTTVGVFTIIAAGLAAGAATSAALLDLKTGTVADLQSVIIAAAGLLAATDLHPAPSLLWCVGGAVLAGGVLALVALSFRAIRGESGLGAGDVGLALALGAWSGAGLVGPALLVACLATLAVGALRGATARTRLPFAPGLCAGFGAVVAARFMLGDVGP